MSYDSSNRNIFIKDVIAAVDIFIDETLKIPRKANPMDRPIHLLTLSAENKDALNGLLEKYSHYLGFYRERSIADVCFAVNTGNTQFLSRLAIVANSIEEFEKHLKTVAAGRSSGAYVTGKSWRTKPRIGFIFTGQGAQYAGMGKAMFDADPPFKSHIKRCSELLHPHFGFPLEELLWGTKKTLLHQTRYTQPALYVLQTGLLIYLERCGIHADAVLGHSIGEYAAAYAAGVFSLEQGLKLIAARGALMSNHCPLGSMIVVFDAADRVQPFVEAKSSKISIATINSPRHTILSGNSDTLNQLAAELVKRRIKVQWLPVYHGFHSVQMGPMLGPFEKVLAQTKLEHPKQTFFSTLTARKENEKLTQTGYWLDQVQKPVNFKEAIRKMIASGMDVLLEVGPGATLTILGQLCAASPNILWLNSQMPNHEWEILLHSLAQIYVRGANIDWRGYDAPYRRQGVPLPVYQFNNKQFWPKPSIPSNVLAETKALSDSDIDTLNSL